MRFLEQLFSNSTNTQLVFLFLAAATWLGGGNVLIACHYRRLGKPWWSGFRPFAFALKDFNAKEWVILAALAFLGLKFAAIALNLGQR